MAVRNNRPSEVKPAATHLLASDESGEDTGEGTDGRNTAPPTQHSCLSILRKKNGKKGIIVSTAGAHSNNVMMALEEESDDQEPTEERSQGALQESASSMREVRFESE
mmetsp:Transcript_2671/g.7004  ORF Transcript_2671/g.7004 Transcript_2671/m.7004 type:complete len:108 (-) Transcript_2671:217-540(-)